MNAYSGIVISSRVRLARNAKSIPFPSKLSDERAFSVIMKSAEEVAKSLFNFKFYQMGHLDEIDRQAIFERHLISRDLAQNLKTGAVIVSENEDMSIMINEEDHYRIQAISKGFNLTDALDRAVAFDNVLSGKIELAYSDRLGYLTSCPTNVGTGMRASVMVHLPALTMSGKINSLISSIQQLSLTVRGVYGEGSKADGYMYQISNQVSLGQSEQEIIDSVTKVIDVVCRAEQEERKNMQKRDGLHLIDKITRAYGVLTNATLLSTGELLEFMSYVALGDSLGLFKIKGDLHDLIISAQPANLIKSAGKNMQAQERDEYRAKQVSKALSVMIGGKK
ncbi:MAG: protein arginine kinase [Clostridia bacterium]|nr:protein arginine kinase [Clostridia bacterium]